MRAIKLMADYQCYTLWEASPGAVGNINPIDFPISTSLQNSLLEWADRFDSTLNIDDPLSSGFESEASESKFKTDGAALAEELRQELGKHYVVVSKF